MTLSTSNRVALFRANLICDVDNLPNRIHVHYVVANGRDVAVYSIYNETTNTYQDTVTHDPSKAVILLQQYNQVGANDEADKSETGLVKSFALLVGYLALWSWFCFDVIGGDVLLPVIDMIKG